MKRERRQFLRVVGATTVATLAGCSGSNEADSETAERPGNTETAPDGETGGTEEGSELPPAPESQTAKLVPDDGNSGDMFGWEVATTAEGTTALVTAWGDRGSGGNFAGSAYVFARREGSWRQQTKLVPEDGQARARFGRAATLTDTGTTAVVGAPRDENSIGPNAGAAYVFRVTGGNWSRDAKLVPEDGRGGEFLGKAVAISEEGTLIAGAPSDNTGNRDDAGSAYVFTRSGGSWTQQARLAPESLRAGERVGSAVAISGDGTTAVVGGYGDDRRGEAFAFQRAGDAWQHQATLTPPEGASHPGFGTAVETSRDGSHLVVGAPADEGNGTAHVFRSAGDGWERQTVLTPDDGSASGSFGSAISVSGGGARVLLGAAGDSDPNGEGAGAATVFGQSADGWSRQATLAAEDGAAEDYFGESVSLSADGTTALVGAFWDANSAGSAYVFE